jgi:hypothetical protein
MAPSSVEVNVQHVEPLVDPGHPGPFGPQVGRESGNVVSVY